MSYEASLAIEDHTVLSATHTSELISPRLTAARQAGTRFIYPGEMEG